MHAAVLMLALTAPTQHPVRLDATLLWHELRLFGDGYQRGCGPDCYRCRSCNGVGRCYDFRREFGYPWQPRSTNCAAMTGWTSSPMAGPVPAGYAYPVAPHTTPPPGPAPTNTPRGYYIDNPPEGTAEPRTGPYELPPAATPPPLPEPAYPPPTR